MPRVNKNTPEHLEKISFSNLVKAIDEKWSHTYQPFVNEDPLYWKTCWDIDFDDEVSE